MSKSKRCEKCGHQDRLCRVCAARYDEGFAAAIANMEKRERHAFEVGRLVEGSTTKYWKYETFDDYKKSGGE